MCQVFWKGRVERSSLLLQTETVEEPIEEEEETAKADTEKADTETEEKTDEKDEDEDTVVEDEDKEEKPKTKKVEKTTWDWVLVNDTKPIWLRRSVGVVRWCGGRSFEHLTTLYSI